MYKFTRCTTKSLLLVMLLCVGVAAQASVPVFEYSFPASYDGTGATVTDLSGAGNDLTLHTSGAPLQDDRPAGFDASLMSLSGSNGGHGRTSNIDLLNNTDVAADGGFTMDCWFKWDGSTGTRKLIDYAGTEALRMQGDQVQFVLSNSAYVVGIDIVESQWYHAVGVFNTQGNAAVADPSYAGDYKVDGEMLLYLDGVLVGSQAATKTGFGDSLDRPIGINQWAGGGADWFQGNLFNPTVYLGFPELPVRLVKPSDGAVGTSIDVTPTLRWNSGTDPNIIQHVLYFSTDETWVTNALPTDSAAIVLPVATETYQHTESLVYDTTYYWRVDEVTGNLSNPSEVETGPVWNFTTQISPQSPCTGYRFDGDIDGDCFVGMTDLMLFVQDWMLTSVVSDADIDEDTNVDYVDFAYIGRDWLTDIPRHPIMVVSAHPDDEGIFFGGAMAYYGQVFDAPIVHISTTSGDYTLAPAVREGELTNADAIYFGREITTSIGLPPDPDADLFFPRFRDYPTSTVDQTWDWWNDGVGGNGDAAAGKQKTIDTLATYIRVFQPDVIFTHDFDGEYGHSNHKATAIAAADAYDRAADPSYIDGNDPWQAKKIYIHQSEANGLGSAGRTFVNWLFHDYWEDITIDTDDNGTPDMTPRQVADLGLKEHVTQGQYDASSVYRTGENFDGHHCEWWGLYRSTVGPDTIAAPFTIMGKDYNDGSNDDWAIGDFFENL